MVGSVNNFLKCRYRSSGDASTLPPYCLNIFQKSLGDRMRRLSISLISCSVRSRYSARFCRTILRFYFCFPLYWLIFPFAFAFTACLLHYLIVILSFLLMMLFHSLSSVFPLCLDFLSLITGLLCILSYYSYWAMSSIVIMVSTWLLSAINILCAIAASR